MEKDKLYKLKAEAAGLKPILNIGKNGITDPVIEEVKKQLKAYRLVKIKMLRTIPGGEDIRDAAQKLAESTKSTLIEIRGNTVVLYR
ncbi:MAG: YhbY family RNA-binding protein [Methanosarcinaceae archaeon]|nr:YhbY family RNA-binding protein [Methanosarcinaceae archaeon]